MKKHTHKQKAVKAGNKKQAVAYSAADRKEMLEAATQYCVEAGVRPTPARIREVIANEHGEAVANQVCGNKQVKAAANKTAKTPKAKTTTKPVRRFVFGFSVSAVARALGRAGMKPADAVEAIHRYQPDASPLAVKTFIHAGKHGQRGKPASLSKKQLKELTALAA